MPIASCQVPGTLAARQGAPTQDDSMRVLIVEDDAELQGALERRLGGSGFAVDVWNSGFDDHQIATDNDFAGEPGLGVALHLDQNRCGFLPQVGKDQSLCS